MISILKCIVLLVICETINCQTEAAINRGLNITKYEDERTKSHQETHTVETLSDELKRQIFIVKDSGLELFNMTRTSDTPSISELEDDQSSKEKQQFKVQRNPDGKLNIVFNDLFFSQKSVRQQNTTSNAKRVTNVSHFTPQKDELPVGPKCRKEGKSFCTDVEDYPAAALAVNLKNQPAKFELLFVNDELPELLNISQRMDPGEESLCRSIEKVVRPRSAETIDLKWHYIVNQDNYTQAVKIEECINENGKCMFADNFPNRYTTKCKQSYAYRQLVASTKTGETFTDYFKLPSCCKCIYSQG